MNHDAGGASASNEPLGLDPERDNLHWHALNYRTAAAQHAEAMWQELARNGPSRSSHMSKSSQAVSGPVESSVRPPADMSADGREVWEWAERLSDRVHTLDELARLGKQVHNARNTCGSCKAWMTDACPRERHDNRAGRKQGPSSMAIKCDRFAMSAMDAASVAKAEDKMAALRLRLQAAQRQFDRRPRGVTPTERKEHL